MPLVSVPLFYVNDGAADKQMETELTSALHLTKPNIDFNDFRRELFSPTEANILVMLTAAKYMTGKNLEALLDIVLHP